MSEKITKLSICRFGFAVGVAWAICIFVLGIFTAFFDYGTAMVTLISSVYIGYKATVLGSIIGAIWGFIDGFIMGVLVAFFYNICKCPKKSE